MATRTLLRVGVVIVSEPAAQARVRYDEALTPVRKEQEMATGPWTDMKIDLVAFRRANDSGAAEVSGAVSQLADRLARRWHADRRGGRDG